MNGVAEPIRIKTNGMLVSRFRRKSHKLLGTRSCKRVYFQQIAGGLNVGAVAEFGKNSTLRFRSESVA